MRILPRRQPADPSLVVVAAVVAAFALCLFMPAVLNDGDTFWHIRAGEWMLDHRAVLHHDIFTFTMPGAPWSTHEWLAEVLLAFAGRSGGWGGVMLLTGLAFAGGVLIVGRRLARALDGLPLLLVMLLMIACAAPYLVARPHILILPILAAWAVMLLDAREAGEAPPLIGAVLIALWANMHGGYIFGLALAGAFGLEAIALAEKTDRLRVFREWAVVGLACAAAIFVTPHGLDGVTFPFKLIGMSSLAGIAEWRPTSFADRDGFEIALLLLIGFALVKPLRLAPSRALLLVGLVYLALAHVRYQLLFGFIAPLLLAEPLRQALAGQGPRTPPRWAAPALAAGLAVLAVVRLTVPMTLPETATAPRAIADALPRDLLKRPVLNAYDYGGYLIWIGARVFSDGRADLYGDDYMARYYAIAAGDQSALDEALSRWKIEWTIMPVGSPVARLMDHRPGWRRLMANDRTVVHIREAAPRG